MEKAKIIIVENDKVAVMQLKTSLETILHEVIATTGKAEEAIEMAEQLKPDIIIMDIKLDGNMDGIQAADIIKRRFGIPIVLLSAYVDEYKLEQLKVTIPFGVLVKPVQERDLRVTIEMALHVAKVDAERRRVENEQEQKVIELSRVNQELRIQQAELKRQIEELKKDSAR